MNITFQQLQKTHGEKAKEVFQQIGKLGGYGDVGTNFDGGLDLTGLTEAQKKQVEKLLETPKAEKGDK